MSDSTAEAITLKPLEPVIPRALPRPGELGRFWDLTLTLAIHETKLRYFGSVLGYFWSLLRPLMLFSVLYLAFTQFIRFGSGIEKYPVVLLTSIVLWTYFAETTSVSVFSLVQRESLLRKVNFPRFAIPLSLSLTTLFHFTLNLMVVLGFVLASGVEPRWSWLFAIPLLAALVMFTVAVSLVLATLYVKARDMGPIWEVFSQILFWGSPVIYGIEAAPDSVEKILAANPLAAILIEMRRVVIDPNAPSLGGVMGGTQYVLVPCAIFLVLVAVGLTMFTRMAPKLAEEL